MQIETYTAEEIADYCSGRYNTPCDEEGSGTNNIAV